MWHGIEKKQNIQSSLLNTILIESNRPLDPDKPLNVKKRKIVYLDIVSVRVEIELNKLSTEV